MFSLGNCAWEHVEGACATCRCFGGLATIFAAQLSASSTAVTLGSEISTHGFGLATLGFGSATLGNGVVGRASGWVHNQFCCSFAFAAEAFSAVSWIAHWPFVLHLLLWFWVYVSLQGACQSLRGLDDHCFGGYFRVCYVLELEKYHVTYPHCSYSYNIDLEAAIVFHRCLDVETGFGMGVSWAWTAHPRGAKDFLM
jgi:hypothetical protein